MHTKTETRRTWRNNGPLCRPPAFAVGLLLLLATAGCASHQTRPLALHSPASLAATAPLAEAPVELKLVTFNVWGLPWWINGADSRRFAHIAAELATLNPDFATLQEVWTRKAQRSAATTNGWWTAKVARSHLFFRRSGLVTLSRYPIVGGEFHPFHVACLPDAVVSKGALKTTIQLASGVRVNLWNTHLQAGESARADRIRCRQIDELTAWVAASDDGQIADMVAGDFNCEPGSPPYQRLQERFGPGVVDPTRDRSVCTYDGMKPQGPTHLALDHVLIRLRQPLQTAQANSAVVFNSLRVQDRLSDHLGVLVDLNLVPRANPATTLDSGLLAARTPRSEDRLLGLPVPFTQHATLSTAPDSFTVR